MCSHLKVFEDKGMFSVLTNAFNWWTRNALPISEGYATTFFIKDVMSHWSHQKRETLHYLEKNELR